MCCPHLSVSCFLWPNTTHTSTHPQYPQLCDLSSFYSCLQEKIVGGLIRSFSFVMGTFALVHILPLFIVVAICTVITHLFLNVQLGCEGWWVSIHGHWIRRNNPVWLVLGSYNPIYGHYNMRQTDDEQQDFLVAPFQTISCFCWVWCRPRSDSSQALWLKHDLRHGVISPDIDIPMISTLSLYYNYFQCM